MAIDPITVVVAILTLFMGGITIYVKRQDKNIDDAHVRIDKMNDIVARHNDLDLLREDIQNLKVGLLREFEQYLDNIEVQCQLKREPYKGQCG